MFSVFSSKFSKKKSKSLRNVEYLRKLNELKTKIQKENENLKKVKDDLANEMRDAARTSETQASILENARNKLVNTFEYDNCVQVIKKAQDLANKLEEENEASSENISDSSQL